MSWSSSVVLFAAIDLALLLGIVLAPAIRRYAIAARRRRRRRVVSEVQRRIGSGDFPGQVAELLRERDAALIVEALSAIAREPAKSAAVLEEAAQLVRAGAPRVRLAASRACRRIMTACPGTRDLLARDPVAPLRVLAVRAAALDAGGPSSSTGPDIVVRAMRDPDPEVRRAALRAPVRLVSEPVMASWMERLADPVLDIRLAAARLIATHSTACDGARLCQVLTRTDDHTSHALLAALSRPDQRVGAEVRSIATDRQAPDRRAAIRLLGTGPDPVARRALLSLLSDGDSAVRLESITATAAFARTAYPQPLDRLLVDRLLALLAEESRQTILAGIVEALACSLDARVPAAFLERIPSSTGPMRERLIESAALFAHLMRSVERAPLVSKGV